MVLLLKQIDRISIIICIEIIFLNVLMLCECFLLKYGSISFEKLSLLCLLISGGDSSIILAALYANKFKEPISNKRKVYV